MNSNPVNKLYTCRYWALGPACPNVDAFGTNVCTYAHWDTGRLASHFQQRGTCMTWKTLGYCGQGAGCWYEHRITSVTGLYQGTIELTGSELQIADAASKAGFNTFRHETLFDLIWAVKRIALQSGSNKFNAVRLPRDPIYPDLWPPIGLRGNKKKKKKRRKALTKAHIPNNPDYPNNPNFHPLPPLMKKRNLEDTMEDNLIDLSYSDNEVSLKLADTASTGTKRQKVLSGETGQHTTASALMKLSKRSNDDFPAFLASTVMKDLPSGSGRRSNANFKAVRDPATQFVPIVPATTEASGITRKLRLVKTYLEDARKAMNTCQETMKATFDVHHEKFTDDETMAALRKLSDCMNKVFDGGKQGAAEVDKVVAWLTQGKDNIL